MARIRTIKPEFWQDEDLAELDSDTRLLAIGLLNHADDEGYFKAHQALIRATVFPFSESSVNIHGMLKRLENIQYLTLFEGSDGKQYGVIRNFKKHQKVNRPSPSKIKGFHVITENSVNDHEQLSAGKEQGTGKGTCISTTTSADEKIEILVVKPQPENPKVEDDHPVWQFEPSKLVFNEIQRFKIPSQFVDEQVSEFKTYWSTREHYARYDSKFLSQVLRNWKTQAHSWTPTPEVTHDNANQSSNRSGPAQRQSTVEQATQHNMQYLEQLEREIAELERQEASGGYDEALAVVNG